MHAFHPLLQACSILGRKRLDPLCQTTEGYADSHKVPPENKTITLQEKS